MSLSGSVPNDGCLLNMLSSLKFSSIPSTAVEGRKTSWRLCYDLSLSLKIGNTCFFGPENDTRAFKEFFIILLSSGMKFTEEREVNANLRRDTHQCHLCTRA